MRVKKSKTNEALSFHNIHNNEDFTTFLTNVFVSSNLFIQYVFPGNLTQAFGVSNAMLYQLSHGPKSDSYEEKKSFSSLLSFSCLFTVPSDINTLCSGAVPSDLPDTTLPKKTHLYLTSMKNYKPGLLLPWLLLWNELFPIMNYTVHLIPPPRFPLL